MSLPRSALLAAWAGAVVAGRAGVADAVAAVTGDEEHDVAWAPGAPGEPTPSQAAGFPVPDTAYLSDLLVIVSAAAEGGGARVRVALPAPGDAAGLPPATGLLGHAADAGECVVVEQLRGADQAFHLAAVPDVEEFGTAIEPGRHVTWTAWVTSRPTPAGAVPGPTSIAEADLELRLALREATAELERLDVASWRGLQPPDQGDVPALPATFGARSRGLLLTASRVADIVHAAGEDPGGAVSTHDAGARAAVLSRVQRAARRAVEAAVNLPG